VLALVSGHVVRLRLFSVTVALRKLIWIWCMKIKPSFSAPICKMTWYLGRGDLGMQRSLTVSKQLWQQWLVLACISYIWCGVRLFKWTVVNPDVGWVLVRDYFDWMWVDGFLCYNLGFGIPFDSLVVIKFNVKYYCIGCV